MYLLGPVFSDKVFFTENNALKFIKKITNGIYLQRIHHEKWKNSLLKIARLTLK